ncbi:MAG TPA: M24 family metallopeptidase [Ignavibacteriaceae bacterium]|nr:M24 family metallopeptidase [Ignavibacteriaceae bacterium]
MAKFNLNRIQEILRQSNIDGWLLYDFRGSNEFAINILDIPPNAHLTRRFYYLIPKEGNPVKIVMAIESGHLDHLPGEKLTYSSHELLTKHLENSLKKYKTIAMEYSPKNAIPYVSKVDAGTIEQIKSYGIKVVSSADLISMFDAVWTDDQFKENRIVAYALNDIVDEAFGFIRDKISNLNVTNEYEVQQFIMHEFAKRDFITDSPPIVGVNENSANPHYAPDRDKHKSIHNGDFVLIDLWARFNKLNSVWADITWVGFAADAVPEKYTRIFRIVEKARDAAFDLVLKRMREKKELRGYEVDNAAREVIRNEGMEKYFIHRTGHSITTDLHGSGPHMDNYETKDERLILPSTSFSIEPGIYLPDEFGIRSEIDVFIHPDGDVIATGSRKQTEIIPILAP